MKTNNLFALLLITLSIQSSQAMSKGINPKNVTRFCMFFPLTKFCMGIWAGGGKKRNLNASEIFLEINAKSTRIVNDFNKNNPEFFIKTAK
jgi:hypothetical protein